MITFAQQQYTIVNDLIAERIRTIIEHYGLTVSSFADKIGVQRSSISHLLKGRNKPSLDFVLKVVQAYPEVNLYWLLNGKGQFPTEDKMTSIEEIHNEPISKVETTTPQNTREAVKIVIFYSDGSFESFNAKK